jgi:hypothetical protein
MNPAGRTALRAPAALLIAFLVLAVLPGMAMATVAPLAANLNDGSFDEFSQTNTDRGALGINSLRTYDGTASAHATYEGNGGNGYARGIWNVNWQDGEDVWFGAAYYLPVGFVPHIQGQVDLMRWDNWLSHPSDTDWGGVSIYGSDHHARLVRFGAGRSNDTLVGPTTLPEGRWFTLEVHERLSAGAGALSELYVDGKLVGKSSRPNTYGRPIERIRYGIVAIAEGAQTKPLELWFDDATAGPTPAPGSIAPIASKPPTISRRRSDRTSVCGSSREIRHGHRAGLACRVQA